MSGKRRNAFVTLCLSMLYLGFSVRAQTTPPFAPLAFTDRADFATGANPTRFDIADVNGDGFLDVVTANFYTNTTVSVLLGVGDGTFQPHVDYEAGYVPYAVKIADYDRDGKMDLAVTNREPGTVSILRGNGDGTFLPRIAYPAGRGPVTLVVEDFNSDGKPDLAVGALVDGAAAILLGNGDGTFEPPVEYATGFFIYSLIAGDFNADHKIDLASANYLADTVSVLLGNGDGSFQAGVHYAATNPIGLVAGDFDGNGTLDLAATVSPNAVLTFMGRGDGTFGSPASYDVGPGPAFMEVAADVNGDGRLDLVVPTYLNNSVSVLAGRDDGTFSAREEYAVGSGPISASVSDFNADGRPDLAVTNAHGHSLTILLGGGGDTTPPTITLLNRTVPNAAGWNNTDVTISWACSDTGGSGTVAAVVHASISTEGASQSVTGTCADLAGNIASDTQSDINIDKTRPTITAAASTLPNASGWYAGNVTVRFTCTDSLSGMPVDECPSDQILTGEGAAVSSIAQAVTDAAGNTSAVSNVVTVKIDKTAPTLSPVLTPSPVLLNGAGTATSGAADALSGVASQSCGALVTDSVGSKSVSCSATDHAGNTGHQAVSYSVVYRFDGFLQPINDTAHSQWCVSPCPVSVLKGGSTVPVKFQLKDAHGNVVQAGNLPLWGTPTQAGATTAPIEESTYSDPVTGSTTYRWTDPNYVYNWSTKGTAAGYYWRIGVTLDDGQTYFVYVGLR